MRIQRGSACVFVLLLSCLSGSAQGQSFGDGSSPFCFYPTLQAAVDRTQQDLQAREGSRFSLKSFHDRLLGQGSLPLWLHRTLLLGDTGDALLD